MRQKNDVKLHVHHRESRKTGGNAPDNLMTLCEDCHKKLRKGIITAEDFKKSKRDDLTNMQTGIFGYKGRVRYCLASPVNTWIHELANLPKGEFFTELARGIDRAIHTSYTIFPINYVAVDLLQGTQNYTHCYTPDDKQRFEQYLQSRLDLIDLPDKDEDFLRRSMLTMYANPAINKRKTVTKE